MRIYKNSAPPEGPGGAKWKGNGFIAVGEQGLQALCSHERQLT